MITLNSPEDAKGPLGAARRWVTDVIREASTTMQSLVAFSALLASINPMLSILIRGHAAVIVNLVVSIVGSVLAVLSMVILVAQKVVSILDGSGSLGALSGAGGDAESALVKEADITEGTVLVDHGDKAWEDLANLKNDLNTLRGSFQQGGPSDTRPAIESTSSDATKVGGDEL